MCDEEFQPPPEAPVFEPNEQDFADPLGYIAKIRPIAEKAGICKVRPPPYWQPPFAIDVENFKFTPRIQRLNELGIQTRMRLQFIHKVAKFWELQGTQFKLPHIAGRPLDIYGLHRAVQQLGGFENITKNRQWNYVCQNMGLIKNLSATVKQHYEKLLYPYDIMLSGILLEAVSEPGKVKPGRMGGHFVSPHKPKDETQEEAKPKCKRRYVENNMLVDVSNNKELAKLQLFGAGPKMMGLGLIAKRKNRLKSQEAEEAKVKDEVAKSNDNSDNKNIFDLMAFDSKEHVTVKNEADVSDSQKVDSVVETRRKGADQIPYAVLDSIDNCKICMKDENETCLLLCDGCDDSYHTYCLIPPLQSVPKGDWCCPRCLAKECNKKMDAYGFEQARKEYTLQSFGEMADTFKSEYFTKPAHLIPTEVVEKEFWRLVGSLEENLSVQYGADIHVLDQGSGFPRLCDNSKHPLSPEETAYAKSGWNLNNLPVSKQSLLNCMSGDISGMKVPWVYVGMCFSAFCWHIEDHWTYSINYLHWGEPKTWYGVPREDAVKLEQVMKDVAPDLFQQHPDIMHHLVTTINPSVLVKNGVRVVRTNQCAGEFVITFPRAYHAGFNQGYNFAEAVNFSPADWIPIGRQSVKHYRSVGRPCVFSHEEIICKVANSPDTLDVQLAAAVYKDMMLLIEEENFARDKLNLQGIVATERIAFELVPDDERQCCVCKTTCFLSAVVCACVPEKLACPDHVKELCGTCPMSTYVLRYRYTLDELKPMLCKVKQRAESFETWSYKVESALSRSDDKLTLAELKALFEEAAEGKFPENDKLHKLQSAIREAEKCSRLAQQLVTVRKHRTRQKEINNATGAVPHSAGCMLSLGEVRAFYEQLINLPCSIAHLTQVCEYIERVEKFVEQTEHILQEDEPESEKIQVLIENSLGFDLDLPQIVLLHHALQQAKWLERVRATLLPDNDDGVVTLDELRQLIDAGVSLAPRAAVERAMAELQELLNLSEAWEDKAHAFLELSGQGSLKAAQVITSESENVPVDLPYCSQLREVVHRADLWVDQLRSIQNLNFYPYLDTLESLLYQAPTDIKLLQLPLLTTQVEAAQEWKDKTSRAFLKKNSLYTLHDVLHPRTGANETCSLKAMRRKIRDAEIEHQQSRERIAKIDSSEYKNQVHPGEVVDKIKAMEEKEVDMIKNVRIQNNKKTGVGGVASLNTTDVYCVCRKPSSGFMLQCELCHDWFHGSCMPPIRFNKGKDKLRQIYELKFLCPLCHRSRRPRLEIILSLLLQLQKLPVRIREGEALQCLTERAMNWQDRARAILHSHSCVSLLKEVDSKLKDNVFKKNDNQTTAQCTKRVSSLDSIDDTINNVIMKTCNDDDVKTGASGVEALLSAASKTETEAEDVMEAAEVLAMFACGNNQPIHIKQEQDVVKVEGNVSNVKNVSQNVVSQKFPLIDLPHLLKNQLEDLMMEGDLLEVTLDETQHIWTLLQASRPLDDARFQELCDVDSGDVSKPVTDKDAKRKRKPESIQNVDKRKRRQSAQESAIGSGNGVTKADGGKKKKYQAKKSALAALVAADDDEFALCAISNATEGQVRCQQPTGEEVDWLQCDGGCEAWFHCVCVSVTPEEAKDLDYVCDKCRRVTFCNRDDTGRVSRNGNSQNVNTDRDLTTSHNNISELRPLLT